MLTILILTLTILLAITCFSIYALTRQCRTCLMWMEMTKASEARYATLTSRLLGAAEDAPTETMSSPPSSANWPEPENDFALLSPEIQEAILREQSEMNGSRNLSGKPPRQNPNVPQITPGLLPSEAQLPTT